MILAKIDWTFSNGVALDWAGLAWAQFWQLTFVAIAVGLIARLLLRHRPHLAYLLWMLVIIKAVTPPVVSSPTGVFSWALREPSRPRATEPIAAQPQIDATPEAQQPELAASPGDQPSPHHAIAASLLAQQAPAEAPAAKSSFGRLLAIVWGTGAAAMALFVAAKWIAIRRRWNAGAVAVSAELREQVDELAERLALRPGARRRVRILVSQAADSPAVYGVWRPTILLPARLFSAQFVSATDSGEINKTPDARGAGLSPILAHELVHIRRGDTFAATLQLVAQALWWFHPLVWWANREARRERERSCDEETVVGLGCSPRIYARVLLDVLELQSRRTPALAVPGVGMLGITAARMEHLLRRPASFHRRTPRPFFAVAIVALLALLPGAGLQSAGPEAAAQTAEKDGAESKPAEDTSDEPIAINGAGTFTITVDEKDNAVAEPPPAILPITVKGRATDEAGEPVAGAKVFLLGRDAQPPVLASAKTNADGRYEFRDAKMPIDVDGQLPQGWIQVHATSPGKGVAWDSGRSVLAERRRADVVVLSLDDGPGLTYADDPLVMDLVFRPQQVFRGRITDEKGQPIVGADVGVAMLDDSRLQKKVPDLSSRHLEAVRSVVPSAKTDADGRFESHGLPRGATASVGLWHPDYGNRMYEVVFADKADPRQPNGVRTRAPLIAGELNVSMARAPKSKVLVTDQDDRPISEIEVTSFTGKQPVIVALEKTGADGMATLELPPDQYKLSVFPTRKYPPINFLPATAMLDVKATAAAEPLRVKLSPGAQVELSCVEAETGRGVQRVSFLEYPDKAAANQIPSLVGHVTDAAGKLIVVTEPGRRRFDISVLPDGYEIVSAENEQIELEAGKTTKLAYKVRRKAPPAAPQEKVQFNRGSVNLQGEKTKPPLNSTTDTTKKPQESVPSKETAALRERAKLAFEIDCGFDGMMAAAVDKEERFLVVGGNLRPKAEGSDVFSDWVEGKGRGVIDLWDLHERKKLKRLEGDYGAVLGAAFSPDAKLLATAGRQFNDALRGEALLWDLTTGKPVESLKYVPTPVKEGTQMWQISAAFSADGSLLAAGGFDRSPVVWSLPTGKEIQRLPKQPSFSDHLLFTPDGGRLIVPSRAGDVTIWDTKTWKSVRELKVENLFLLGAALAPDGKTLAVGGEKTSQDDAGKRTLTNGESENEEKKKGSPLTNSGQVTVWDLTSGKVLAELKLDGMVSGLSFSPDGRLLAAAGMAEDVTIWDWAKKEVFALIPQTHRSSGDKLQFLPRSGRLMIHANSEKVLFYDLK